MGKIDCGKKVHITNNRKYMKKGERVRWRRGWGMYKGREGGRKEGRGRKGGKKEVRKRKERRKLGRKEVRKERK